MLKKAIRISGTLGSIGMIITFYLHSWVTINEIKMTLPLFVILFVSFMCFMGGGAMLLFLGLYSFWNQVTYRPISREKKPVMHELQQLLIRLGLVNLDDEVSIQEHPHRPDLE